MSLAIGCDKAAFNLKEAIKEYVERLGYDVGDYGIDETSPALYPDIAVQVATAVAEGKHDRGILLGSSGIGMVIMANKVPGIRAAQCHDPFSAEEARTKHHAQIMTMGAQIIGTELAKLLVYTWLNAEFQGGRSTQDLEKIMEYEHRFHHKEYAT